MLGNGSSNDGQMGGGGFHRGGGGGGGSSRGFVPRMSTPEKQSPSNDATTASKHARQGQLSLEDKRRDADHESPQGNTNQELNHEDRELSENASEGSRPTEEDPLMAQRAAMKALMAAGRDAAGAHRKSLKDAAKEAAKGNTDATPPTKAAKKKATRVSQAATAAAATVAAAAAPALKRPAAAIFGEPIPKKRPSVLAAEHVTVWYMGGKLQKSNPKGGFRCFAKHPNPSDKIFRWDDESKPALQKAWDAACSHIENIRGNKK